MEGGAFCICDTEKENAMMTSSELRESFLRFFVEKRHTVVPSASLMPQSPGLLFTNAGMNQFVPYFLGEMAPPWNPARATDTQKCIRAGGKHNDLEDVGQDSYHHTFFEMLGNWSFGDYFKKEAIAWAWELLVERWHFPVERLYATVYEPAEGEPGEFDQEAHDAWADLFRAAGYDPGVHVINGHAHDNFWMMGETGPCGPSSELHIDLTPAGDTRGALVNAESDRCIEIWNLVFIQYNAEKDGSYRPLPTRHVDTGMGLERAAAMLQCTDNFTDFTRRISNYGTDVFRPLFAKLEELTGRTYVDIYPGEAGTEQGATLRESIAFRVIADHIRTLAFSIADGIQPGNTGRNYVLRRILRRAVRYGRHLGLTQPFLAEMVDTLAEQMGREYPELREREGTIKEVLRREETAFNETLDRGLELFDREVENNGAVAGEFAFRLYDTYGFPLDLTQLLARERGLTVDTQRFEELMEEQRQRAKAARRTQVVRALDIRTEQHTNFDGYEHDSETARVTEIYEQEGVLYVITDRTPFYAEMGGQVGDSGTLRYGGEVRVVEGVRQIGDARAHLIRLRDGERPTEGEEVTLSIDTERRRAIEAHHSATHLLHRALREVVGEDAAQQGSLVDSEHLRFDVNAGPISKEQLQRVEELVNDWVARDLPVTCREHAMSEIRLHKEVAQFFGEKYGDVVRLVQMGGTDGNFDGVSMELCGGTHVRSTGQIGFFKIRSEGAIASGVRRIEAACGEAGYGVVRQMVEARLPECREAREKLSAVNEQLRELGRETHPAPADDERTAEKALAARDIREVNRWLDKFYAYVASLKETAQEADKQMKKARAEAAAKRAGALLAEQLQDDRTVLAVEGGADILAELLNGLRRRMYGGAAVLVADDGAVLYLGVYCGEKARGEGLVAGELVRTLVPLISGKGGGKEETARGSGSDRTAKEELLRAAKKILCIT